MAHLRLGNYYRSVAGITAGAFPSIDRAYKLRGRVTDRESHFIAAEYFNAHQQFDEARDSLKALTTLYPADPEFSYALALAHYSLEEIAPAIAALRQVDSLEPLCGASARHPRLVSRPQQSASCGARRQRRGEQGRRRVTIPLLGAGVGACGNQ